MCLSVHIKYNVSVKTQQFCYIKCYFRATCFDSFWVIFRPSNLLTLDLYFRGPEDDSERVETRCPKIAFYVIKLLCFFTDTLYFICTIVQRFSANELLSTDGDIAQLEVLCVCVCVCVCVRVRVRVWSGQGLERIFNSLCHL